MEKRALPSWAEEVIRYIDIQLNWMDLVAFGLGFLIVTIVLYLLIREKKRVHAEEVASICETYENLLQEIRRAHLEEIEKAEHAAWVFKEKLRKIESEFRSQKVDDSKREVFESEIEHLKDEMDQSHREHAKEVERLNLEINDLRKQMRILMYRV